MVSLLAVTACDDGASPTTPAALDPGLIAAALDRSLESTAVIEATVTAGAVDITISGAVDAPAGVLKVSMSGPTELEAFTTSGSLYVKADGPAGESWMKVDFARLRPESQLRGGVDIRSQAGIVAGIVSVEQVGPGSYKGVADLNAAAAAADESQRAALSAAASVAQNASAVPYEATIDGQGRLTRLFYAMEMPSGAVETTLALSNFGEPVQVQTPPESEVWEATDDMYAVL